MKSINFPNVSVWNRSLFKYLDKYCVMNKYNGLRTKIIEDSYIFDCENMPDEPFTKIIIIFDNFNIDKELDEYPQ